MARGSMRCALGFRDSCRLNSFKSMALYSPRMDHHDRLSPMSFMIKPLTLNFKFCNKCIAKMPPMLVPTK